MTPSLKKPQSGMPLVKAPCFLAKLTVAGLLAISVAFAAEPAAQEKTGLAVGQKAPAFSLQDQNDRNVSLESLLRKGPLALVFYRSADW